MDNRVAGTPIEVYQVYLDGEKIGLITSKDELLEMIDREQSSIKEEYGVENVYPPDGLDVQKVYTYNDDISDVATIYNSIKDIEPFTIEGYTVTITYTEQEIINDIEISDPAEPLKIYLLDRDIIEEALYNTATAFIGTEELTSYEEGTQVEITETGEIITSVYFEETITIKQSSVSTEEYIFNDVEELSRYLLFGTLEAQETYITKAGENLEAIADANSLNIEELLIANPQYPSADVLLVEGEEINVGLIDPLVSVVYRKTVVDDINVNYKTEYVEDSSKYTDYRETTTEGQNGVTRITQNIKYVNGEIQSLTIDKREEIVPVVNEVITRGTKVLGGGYYYYENEQGNSEWSWPTISPFVITSRLDSFQHVDCVSFVVGSYRSAIFVTFPFIRIRTRYIFDHPLRYPFQIFPFVQIAHAVVFGKLMDKSYGNTFEPPCQVVDKGYREPVKSPFRPTVVFVQAEG